MGFKKIIVTIGLTVFSSAIMAHSNECQFSIDHNIEIVKQKLLFEKDHQQLTFTNDQLLINGKAVALSDEQLKVSQKFQRAIMGVVPKIADIAIEGAELGVKTATLVVTSLFGSGDDVHRDLIEPIEKIAAKVRNNISVNAINTKALRESFDEEFGQELESLLANAMSKYASKMASRLISSIFSQDNEEMEDFEFRMENMGNDIEKYVESHAESIEAKAEALCLDFDRLADLDEQLREIKGYPKKGLIQKDAEDGFRISSINFDFN